MKYEHDAAFLAAMTLLSNEDRHRAECDLLWYGRAQVLIRADGTAKWISVDDLDHPHE